MRRHFLPFQACANHNFKKTQSFFFTPCSRDTHSQLIPRKILVDIISFLAQMFDGRIPALLLYTQTQSETFFKDVSSKCSCYEPSGFRAKILLSKVIFCKQAPFSIQNQGYLTYSDKTAKVSNNIVGKTCKR